MSDDYPMSPEVPGSSSNAPLQTNPTAIWLTQEAAPIPEKSDRFPEYIEPPEYRSLDELNRRNIQATRGPSGSPVSPDFIEIPTESPDALLQISSPLGEEANEIEPLTPSVPPKLIPKPRVIYCCCFNSKRRCMKIIGPIMFLLSCCFAAVSFILYPRSPGTTFASITTSQSSVTYITPKNVDPIFSLRWANSRNPFYATGIFSLPTSFQSENFIKYDMKRVSFTLWMLLPDGKTVFHDLKMQTSMPISFPSRGSTIVSVVYVYH